MQLSQSLLHSPSPLLHHPPTRPNHIPPNQIPMKPEDISPSLKGIIYVIFPSSRCESIHDSSSLRQTSTY